jgi:hypothetical protein
MLKRMFNGPFNKIMLVFVFVLLVCAVFQFFAGNTRQALTATSLIVLAIAGMIAFG